MTRRIWNDEIKEQYRVASVKKREARFRRWEGDTPFKAFVYWSKVWIHAIAIVMFWVAIAIAAFFFLVHIGLL